MAALNDNERARLRGFTRTFTSRSLWLPIASPNERLSQSFEQTISVMNPNEAYANRDIVRRLRLTASDDMHHRTMVMLHNAELRPGLESLDDFFRSQSSESRPN